MKRGLIFSYIKKSAIQLNLIPLKIIFNPLIFNFKSTQAK